MAKYLFIFLVAILIGSCGGKKHETDTSEADSTSTNVDTLTSDVNWGDDDTNKEEKKHHHHSSHSSSNDDDNSSSGRSGGGGGASDNDADVLKYQNYQRNGDSPSDFANAAIFPAIRMVYGDYFAKPKATVLNSTKDGEVHTIDLKITWKDHWVPEYKISGTLTVNSDGSNAKFIITDKNKAVEMLEFTSDDYKTEATLPTL